MSQLKNRTEDLRDKAAQLEAENEDLQEDIEQVDSIQGIVEIAEKELGLAQPDAVFYGEEP
jgi:cell division protein FtsB